MTRAWIYWASAAVYVATIAMTIAAIIVPEWIVWDAPFPKTTMQSSSHSHMYDTSPRLELYNPTTISSMNATDRAHYSYGLHSKCNSHGCQPFPVYEECLGSERKFCTLWRTTGFLMSMAVVIELAGLVGFIITISGGKQRRQFGWKVIVGVLALCTACQATAMALMLDVHEKDERFFAGWNLGPSFVLATLSWVLQGVVAVGLITAAYLLPEEGDYELIPNRPGLE